MSMETGTATNATDLLDKLNTFLLKGHSLTPSYTGTGNGLISGIIGSATTSQETITITFTSATAYGVVGSVTGSMGTGTVGTPFSHAKVGFNISAGGTAWVSGDTIVFVMTPPWIQKRGVGNVGRIAILGDFSNVTYPAANAFDGSQTTLAAISGAGPHYLGVQYSSAVALTRFIITGSTTASESIRDFTLEYSDNGSSWTTAGTYTSQTGWAISEQRTFTVGGSPGSHAYWRLNITANNGGSFYTVGEWVMFDGPNPENVLPRAMEYIWQAPGNANTDQIFVGARYFTDPIGYYNWQLGGFTAYSTGVDFGLQPGSIVNSSTLRGPVLPLWNSSIPYWFFANGRRVMIIAKISTSYESAYLGFIETYPSPGQWAYPLAVGSSMAFNGEPASNSISWAYTNGTTSHSAFFRAVPDATNDKSQMMLRRPDGYWRGFASTVYNASQGSIWPYANSMTDLRANLDGTYPIFPIVMSESTPNIFGRFDGVFATTGYGNAVENTFTIGRDTWLVLQNITRTTKIDFCAMRMD